MVTKYNADHLHWTLGTCSASLQYTNFKTIKEKDCCLAPGNHTLTCYNTKQPHGKDKQTLPHLEQHLLHVLLFLPRERRSVFDIDFGVKLVSS